MHKRTLATLLFSVYFLLYAVSPLTYAVHEKKAGEGSIESPDSAPSVRGLHYSLWEVITERSSARNSAGSHNAAGTPILIKKKRAVVPEDDTDGLNVSGQEAPMSGHALPPRDVLVSRAVPDAPRNLPTGFHPIYAGHSPPLV